MEKGEVYDIQGPALEDSCVTIKKIQKESIVNDNFKYWKKGHLNV